MSDLGPLGERVRERRQAQGLTLRALAERSGVSLRFLSDLEHGNGNISIARLLDVARALSTPVAELVSALDAPPESKRPVVALVGLRGAGKSTIGRRAAERLAVPFVELDQEIEAGAGMPLQQIFEMYGDSYYRRLERDALSRVLERAEKKGAVIAAGGGIVMDGESWALLKRRARVVWLKARPEDHYRRVMAQGDLRPMANRPGAMSELEQLLGRRAPLYAQAHASIDTSALPVERAVAELCAGAA